jgi:hypothetical protein
MGGKLKMKRSYFLQGILLGILAAVLCFAYNTYLMPVGSINGQAIYRYQVRPYVAASSGNAVKSCAKDKLFYEAVNRLGVTVPDTLVESELQKYAEKYGGRTELENILLDTTQDMESIRNSIKKSLIHQKALDYYISKEAPSLMKSGNITMKTPKAILKVLRKNTALF